MEQIMYIIFYSMFPMIFLWFHLTNKLFALLKTYHPIKYSEMGDPTLFRNNNPQTGYAFLAFLIFKKEWKNLNDKRIEKLCKLMLFLFYIYMALFLTMLVLIPIHSINT